MLRSCEVTAPPDPAAARCKVVSVRTNCSNINHKHFIAKPARTTSSPRFVSDTIYELADFQTEAHQKSWKYLPYGLIYSYHTKNT